MVVEAVVVVGAEGTLSWTSMAEMRCEEHGETTRSLFIHTAAPDRALFLTHLSLSHSLSPSFPL